MESRCFWPPETFVPPWAITESKPSFISEMNSTACAVSAASTTSSVQAPSRP